MEPGSLISAVQRHSVAQEKLAVITSSLRQHSRATNGSGRTQHAAIALDALASQLFARAPVSFLMRRSAESLIELAERVAELLGKFLSTDRQPMVACAQLNDRQAEVIIAVNDMAFSVSTISACAQSSGVKVHALLHPVLDFSTGKVALAVLEVESPSIAGVLNIFENSLRQNMSALQLVNSDFAEMKQLAGNLGAALQAAPEAREAAEFLNWLCDEHFVFLGACEFPNSDGHNRAAKVASPPSGLLGLMRSEHPLLPTILKQCSSDNASAFGQAHLRPAGLTVSRLNVVCPVHRRVRLMHISVISPDNNPRLFSFVGQLTSRGFAEEASSVPIVRRKLEEIYKVEHQSPNSQDYKTTRAVFDSMQKHEALILDTETLRSEVRAILSMHGTKESCALVRRDPNGRSFWIVVILPVERARSELRENILRYLSSTFGVRTELLDWHLSAANGPLSRYYLYVPADIDRFPDQTLREIELSLEQITRAWSDVLYEKVQAGRPEPLPPSLRDISTIFPADYQAMFSPEEALEDVDALHDLIKIRASGQSIRIFISKHLRVPLQQGATCTIKVFSVARELILSDSLPLLENCGFQVLHERSFRLVHPELQDVYTHHFLVRFKLPVVKAPDDASVSAALEDLFSRQAQDDQLNALIFQSALNLRQLALLRAYISLLWQVRKLASRGAMHLSLVGNPGSAKLLWRIFELKFCPQLNLGIEERQAAIIPLVEEFKDSLHLVNDIGHDRILRTLLALVEHTVRTNYYQNRAEIALKLHSEKLDIILPPRPLYEIFVSSAQIEGIHLRSSAVARGGIRISDRRDDYRTEVRDLMKTQRLKNAFIVPSGAKGGFIIKDSHSAADKVGAGTGQSETKKAYQSYIRALLSVTDNVVDRQVVPPEGVLRYDGDDPYLVVAADKGTATFSDIANEIAVNEFGFWLGDAFASGGSSGYDHKALGVTARGAWEVAKLHLAELGIDYDNKPFTVIGIGDMSGDVFGNGLLLSKEAKLIAAFNHKHIFLDPNPNPAGSWEERNRLFNLNASQWSDYDSKLISPGGGVFDRFAREIRLSSAARKALSVASDVPEVVSGEQLVSIILKAKADLLWNGGIGTYVRGSEESDTDVNDSANDRVRVSADQLRVSAVAEGGNLGFTQRARVQFAQLGGLINTDAIDNSGGVDTSDHEVNLKLILQPALRSKRITFKQRDELLLKVRDFVVSRVLGHNRSQSLVLSSAVRRGARNLAYFRTLIAMLAKRGYIDRRLDVLPEDEQLRERLRGGKGLLRPELAVCLAAVKMWVKDEILKSSFLESDLLRDALEEYFPGELSQFIGDGFENGTLTKHLIATFTTNELIDTVGLTFVHRVALESSTSAAEVIESLVVAYKLLRIRKIRGEVDRLSGFREHEVLLGLRKDVSVALREATSWFVGLFAPLKHQMTSPQGPLEKYGALLDGLLRAPQDIFTGNMLEFFKANLSKYKQSGLAPNIANKFAVFSMVPLCLEIFAVADGCRCELKSAANVYGTLLDSLNIYQVLTIQRSIETTDRWEYQLKLSCYDEIRRNVGRLAMEFIQNGITLAEQVNATLAEMTIDGSMQSTVSELIEARANEHTKRVAVLASLARQLVKLRLPGVIKNNPV